MRPGPADRPPARPRPWRWLGTTVLLASAVVAIDTALNRFLGEASLPAGQVMRRVADALIAVLVTGCLWALASLFGAQTTRRRILKIVAVLVMLAFTLPLAMCAMVAGLQLT